MRPLSHLAAIMVAYRVIRSHTRWLDMQKDIQKLLDKHQELTHSEMKTVVSHTQRVVDDWFLNTLMIDDCDIPFRYRRRKRYRDLKTTNAMSQERLDDAEAKLASDRASLSAAKAGLAIAEDRLAKAELVSPVDGEVERRHVSVGDYVRNADPLIRERLLTRC